MPDTLTMEHVPPPVRAAVMRQVGAIMAFDVPAASDVAVISTPSRDLKAEWANGSLREWLDREP